MKNFKNYLVILTLLSGIITSSCQIREEKKSATSIELTELKCEYTVNPLGIECKSPRLSWIMRSDTRNQLQTAYQIIAASSFELLQKDSADLWNTGKIISDRSIHIKYNGRKLNSGERCWWKVCVWDKNGNQSEWSEAAFWEAGLLDQNDWKAKWIGYDSKTSPMFRKEFTVNKQIKKARVYISGLGYYELSINGAKIGDHVLDPGQTDYQKRTFYVTYDITGNIKKGANVIGVMLGNGWYNQDVVNSDYFGWKDVVYGKPQLIVQIHITFIDGSDELIVTDETWKASNSPIIQNNIYLGEFYDARLEKKGWNMVGFDATKWKPVKIKGGSGGKLISQKIQAIKKVGIVKPIDISNPKPNVYVYNMGQNFSGWVKLKMKGIKGTTVQLRFAETIAEDGMIDPASTGVYATGVVQTDRYTFKSDSIEEWEPRFTYHGFQYVEATGVAETPALENIEGIVVNTAVENYGKYECSDQMLNKIHDAIRWTVLGNFHSIITDCPHRERCQWLGDAGLISEMSFYNFNAPLLYAKLVRDIKTGSNNGLPNFIAPGRRKSGPATADWGTTFIQVPYFLYLYYGDISIADEHYEQMSFYMDYLQKMDSAFILDKGWGDLFEPGSVSSKRTPKKITSTAYFYYNSKLMSELARILEKTDDVKKYAQLAYSIKDAFIDSFYNAENKTYGSQTANALALNFGLFPENEGLAIATSIKQDVMEKYNGHHSTGHIGSRYIYGELARFGYGHIALKMLTQKTYPSFGDLFLRGATTVWEYWGEREIDETSSGTRSRSHPFYGGLDVWFYNGIAGINPDISQPGFKHIILKPQLTENLTFAKAEFYSAHGLIISDWKNRDDVFLWNISIPVNTKATIYFPKNDNQMISENGKSIEELEGVCFLKTENEQAIYTIGSGDYSFVIKKD